MKDETVRQVDARILRETLAQVYRFVHPTIGKIIIGGLKAYAKALSSYCACPDRVRVPGGEACLDCFKISIPPIAPVEKASLQIAQAPAKKKSPKKAKKVSPA